MNEFLANILYGIYGIVGNYGWAVVLFTLLIRIICFPFDYKSRVGMRRMNKVQPQVQALQKKYAKDQEKLNKKMSELYRKEKVSPLSSCLPMLITMPILFAMFAAMRVVAYQHLCEQTFDILQGKAPVMEGWLWIKNIWVADSPFVAQWPDFNTLRVIGDTDWAKAFAALSPEAVAKLPALTIDGQAVTQWTADLFTKANYGKTVEAMYAAMSSMPEYMQATAGVPGWTNLNLWFTHLTVMQKYNGFFILPVLAAATQYLMTILQPAAPAPTTTQEDNPTQGCNQNFMKWFFPLFSLWICSSYNAVFSIYWVASNVIAGASNFAINWYLDNKDKKTAAVEEGVK